MKTALLPLYLIFITTNLSAEKNWIAIEPMERAKAPQQNAKVDVELSQMQPIKKIMKNAILIKELIDKSKKEKANSANDKNWFELEKMEKK